MRSESVELSSSGTCLSPCCAGAVRSCVSRLPTLIRTAGSVTGSHLRLCVLHGRRRHAKPMESSYLLSPESILQRAVKNAAGGAAPDKRVTCHTFHHSLGTTCSFAEARPRHPHGAGTPRPPRRHREHDLHPRHPVRRSRRPLSTRRDVVLAFRHRRNLSPQSEERSALCDTRPRCNFPRYTPLPHSFTALRIISAA